MVDTSIFCNILAVPGRSQVRDDVFDELRIYIEDGVALFLPMATILDWSGLSLTQLPKIGKAAKIPIVHVPETEERMKITDIEVDRNRSHKSR